MIDQHGNEQGGWLLPSKMIVALCWGAVGIYLSWLQVRATFRALFEHLRKFKKINRK